MRRPKSLLFFIVILITLLAVVRVSIENSISTTGIELTNYQEKLESLKKSNSQLEERYLSKSSLTKIAAKAREDGFVESKNQINLSAPLPLALVQ